MIKIKTLLKEYGLEVTDINCFFGEQPINYRENLDFEATMNTLKDNGITTAVITNFLSLHYDLLEGNSELIRCLKNKDNAFGAIVLSPLVKVTIDDLKSYISNAIDNKILLVRLALKSDFWPLSSKVHGEFYSIINSFSLPILLNLEELEISDKTIYWRGAEEIINALPECPIIISTSYIKELYYIRQFYSLMKIYSNVFLETNNLMLFGIIEDVRDKFGAEKLLFGSNFPIYDPGATISQVLFADISIVDKKKILHLNAQEIFRRIRRDS